MEDLNDIVNDATVKCSNDEMRKLKQRKAVMMSKFPLLD